MYTPVSSSPLHGNRQCFGRRVNRRDVDVLLDGAFGEHIRLALKPALLVRYFEGAKQKVRRVRLKRPAVTVFVHAANIHDTVAGGAVFEKALWKYPSIKGVCADAGYRKTFEVAVAALGRTVDISERIKASGWQILPKRWRKNVLDTYKRLLPSSKYMKLTSRRQVLSIFRLEYSQFMYPYTIL